MRGYRQAHRCHHTSETQAGLISALLTLHPGERCSLDTVEVTHEKG